MKQDSYGNLEEVLALYNRGIHLIFTDIDKIRTIMGQELEKKLDASSAITFKS